MRSHLLRPDVEHRRLLSTFAYLIGTQGVTALLGLAYWPLATHLFTAGEVGIAAAASSTANFLATFGILGMATLLVAEIRTIDARERWLAISTGIAWASASVLVLSLATVGLSPVLGKSVRAMGHDPLVAGLFVVGAVATVAVTTFDNAAIGLRQNRTRFVRAVLESALKLAVVAGFVALGTRSSADLVFAWTAGVVVSLGVGWRMLDVDRARAAGIASRRELTRRFAMPAFHHHVLNLSINSVSYILPVIAALTVLPAEVAYFTTAKVVSSTLMLVPYMLSFALFAESASDEALLRRLIRRTFPISLAACAAIVLGVELAAPLALRIFGGAYAANGSGALRLLVLVGPSYVVKDHYVAIKRAQRRLAEGSKVLALATTAETAAGALGAVLWGLRGMVAAWAVAAAVEAIALLPTLVRVFRVHPQEEIEERTAAAASTSEAAPR